MNNDIEKRFDALDTSIEEHAEHLRVQSEQISDLTRELRSVRETVEHLTEALGDLFRQGGVGNQLSREADAARSKVIDLATRSKASKPPH